jgi:hypothetical protein
MSDTTLCTSGKRRYPDAGTARQSLRGMKRTKGLRQRDDLEAFWCTGCGGWHLGNRRTSDRRRQRGDRRRS